MNWDLMLAVLGCCVLLYLRGDVSGCKASPSSGEDEIQLLLITPLQQSVLHTWRHTVYNHTMHSSSLSGFFVSTDQLPVSTDQLPVCTPSIWEYRMYQRSKI